MVRLQFSVLSVSAWSPKFGAAKDNSRGEGVLKKAGLALDFSGGSQLSVTRSGFESFQKNEACPLVYFITIYTRKKYRKVQDMRKDHEKDKLRGK